MLKRELLLRLLANMNPRSDYLLAAGDSQVALTTTEVMYPNFVAMEFYDPRLSWLRLGGSGQSSTVIADAYLNAQAFYRTSTDVIFDMGINNFSNTEQAVQLIKDDIARAVAGCTTGRYRVMEILPRADGTTNLGSPKRNTLVALNTYLNDNFNFVSRLDDFLAASDGSANDIADVAIGVIPRSLRRSSDNIHRNQAGQRVEAQSVIASLENGW